MGTCLADIQEKERKFSKTVSEEVFYELFLQSEQRYFMNILQSEH